MEEFVNNKEISPTLLVQVGISIILCGTLSFIAGYYWGKKKGAEEFALYVNQQSFADKIYSSLCTLYDAYDDEASNEEKDDDGIKKNSEESSASEPEASETPLEFYCAILCGFGSQKAGLDYVNRLQAKGVKARLATRTSKTPKGMTKTWYQVITMPADYESTIQVAERLKKEDKLTNVMLHKVQNEQKENNL